VVSPNGSNAGAGTAASPWQTLQHASDRVLPGDIVLVRAGRYAGFALGWEDPQSGTTERPITFRADPGVIIDRHNPFTNDGINLERADHIIIDGFALEPAAGEAPWRAAIRAGGGGEGNVIRGNTVRARDVDKYGIYSSFNVDVLVERNTVTGTYNSGIYTANSAARPVIRANVVHHAGGNGIHFNGDASQGGSGVIAGALVEANVVYSVGATIGGGAINMDGVVDSRVQNNLLYDLHGKGITLYKIDAAEASRRNVVTNNTVLVAANGQVPLRINHDASGNVITNNIFLSASPSGAWVDGEESGLEGTTIDYNVNTGVALVGGVPRSDWRSTYGFDAHSLVAAPAALFVNVAANDYHLRSGAVAIDKGTSSRAPARDLAGGRRPGGTGFDIGAYEFPAPPPVRLVAPSNLKAVTLDSTSVRLRWSDNSQGETRYVVRCKIGASGAWHTVAVLGADRTAVTLGGLRPGTKYYFTVRAQRGDSVTAYASYASATTLR
jgi:hypothetical protein